MAKKNQKDDVTQDVQTTPEEQVQTQAENGADNAESAVENVGESQTNDKEGQVIFQSVIRLNCVKSIHRQPMGVAVIALTKLKPCI